jgi:hypothetical protein
VATLEATRDGTLKDFQVAAEEAYADVDALLVAAEVAAGSLNNVAVFLECEDRSFREPIRHAICESCKYLRDYIAKSGGNSQFTFPAVAHELDTIKRLARLAVEVAEDDKKEEATA